VGLAVRYLAVNVIRFRATVAFMTLLATGLLLPAFFLRLLVGSFLAGRTGRVIPTARGRSVTAAVGEDLGLREQGKDHGLLAQGENGLGLFFGQLRP
jgi:hypothetical protein